MSRKKKVRQRRFKLLAFLAVDICLLLVAFNMLSNREELPAETTIASVSTTTAATTTSTTAETKPTVIYASRTATTVTLTTDQIASPNAVLIDLDTNEILADCQSDTPIYPASMTKIMTLLVALESDCALTDTYTMTAAMLQPLIDASASRAGFLPDEVVTFEDLLYGAALPSGADATCAIAEMVAGSEDQFVNLMNQKARSIGMEKTHFMNASGLHDDRHVSTVQDIALLLAYAIQNPECRDILSTPTHTTAATALNPNGIELTSTMFSRMHGTEAEGVVILGGKTGFTSNAKHCLASFAEKNGRRFLAVCAGGETKYTPIYDTITLYDNFIDYTPGATVVPFVGLRSQQGD